MSHPMFRRLFSGFLFIAATIAFSACTVDEGSSSNRYSASASRTKVRSTSVKTGSAPSWSEQMAQARAEREKRAAELKKARDEKLAAKKKEDEA
ncbi:MAG: hypothetical protein CMO47_01830, partial [Verrucomicrobiales bacterium]|nr:hypothetical protein [Verrucomicrobiales bacterium]